MEQFEFFLDGKKIKLEVKVCRSIWSKFSGLMFRRESPPLLFVFNREKKLEIHSLFCKPFIAVWIDENLRATKIEKIAKFGNFSGRGKYLLEILASDKNIGKLGISPSTKLKS